MNVQSYIKSAGFNPNIFLKMPAYSENIIERIEYILRNGAGQGVQRDVAEIIPEIEALLVELKKAIQEERSNRQDEKKEERKQ